MTPILVHLQPFDLAAAARIHVRAGDAAESEAYGLGGENWLAAVIDRPVFSIEVMSPDLDGKVLAGRSRVSLNYANLGLDGKVIKWMGSVARIYSAKELAWPAVTEFDGTVLEESFDRDSDSVTLTLEVDTSFLEGPFLILEYDGSGGINGEAAVRGTLRPSGFGVCENIEPVWFDTTRWIGQLDGYGNTTAITRLMEGLDDRGARVADYATYAALAAAIDSQAIKPGQWGTCVAQGLVGLGAPPVAPIGVNATFNPTMLGAMMYYTLINRRGVSAGNVSFTAFTAMDTACPYPASYWTKDQRDCKDLIEAMAMNLNATPLVTFQRVVTITRGTVTAPVATLDRSGKQLPRVIDSRPISMPKPIYRLKARAARPKSVLTYDQVLFEDTIEDKGAYSASQVYRAGHVVWSADKSSWLYRNATPTSGNAPPVWPTASNAYWENMTPPVTSSSITYADGTPIEARKPGEAGANITESRTAAAILGQGYLATQNNVDWQTRVLGAGKPADNASSDATLAVSGTGMLLQGNRTYRPTGGGSWDGQCYSLEGFTGGAICSFVPGTATAYAYYMAGLNTDPLTDASYGTLDYAFYQANDNALLIYENGGPAGSYGTYTLGDVLSVAYDGVNVRYLKNGEELRKVAAPANLKLYFDSSLVAGEINRIKLGPYRDAASSPVSVNPLTLFGTFSQAVGNSVRKIGGTHGADQGGVYGTLQKNTAFISARPIQGNTWLTLIGFTISTGSFLPYPSSGNWQIQYNASTVGSGMLYIIRSGTVIGSWAIANMNANDRIALVFNGRRVFGMLNGVVYGGDTSAYDAAAGTSFYPVVWDYFCTGDYPSPILEGIIDIRYGSWTDVRTFLDDGFTPLAQAGFRTVEGTAAAITGQGPGATAPSRDVLNYEETPTGITIIRSPGGGQLSSEVSATTGCIVITLPVGFTNTMLRFSVDIYNYQDNTMQTYIISGYNYQPTAQWVSVTAQYIGAEVHSKRIRFGYVGARCVIWIGETSTVWQYPKFVVRDVMAGYSNQGAANWRQGWALTIDTAAPVNVTATITKPRPGDAVFGEGVFETPGGSIATTDNFKTLLGTANAIVGQGTGATASTLGGLDPAAAATLAGLTGNGAVTVGDGVLLKKNLNAGAAITLNGRYGVDAGGASGTLAAQIQVAPSGSGSWSAVATSTTTAVGPTEPGSRQVSGTFTNSTGVQQVFDFRIAGVRSPGSAGGGVRDNQTFLTG